MPDDRGSDNTIDLSLADPSDAASIAAAVTLGNRSRSTLGLLPAGAYVEAAAARGLLLARRRGAVVGYALFGITASHIHLTHLCVDEMLRRQGVARLLVEWISATHGDRPGILAWCRHDYRLGAMWSSLGFTRQGERPARSGGGRRLVAWWRDHGHPALFDRPPISVVVHAAIDLNILRDLADPARTDSAEAQALVSDQFSDRLELVKTRALDLEIDALDGDVRDACVRQANLLPASQGDRRHVSQANAELVVGARAHEPSFPSEPQDLADVAHVADAIAAGLNVFITRDERLRRLFADVAERHGLRILRPAEALVRLDELVHAEAYRPAALQQTAFTRHRIPAGADDDVLSLRQEGAGERRAELQRRLRDLATRDLAREGVYGPDGRLVAAWIVSGSAQRLEVPLLRVAPNVLADTLARQILFLLRQQARTAGTSTIQITDPHAPRSVVVAALQDAFLPTPDGLAGFVVDVCGTAGEVEHAAALAARAAGLPEPAALPRPLSRAAAAEVELAWWPAKLTDSPLHTYLVPIRPAFATMLLGVPRGLLRRETGLGLSREHVYYRTPVGSKVTAPARILWYVTAGGQRRIDDQRVIACSQLDDVIDGPADDLYSRFRHLGVWDLVQVRRAAQRGTVEALRFTNTELLPRPITLDRLRQLALVRGRRLALRAPQLLAPDLFAAVYLEGGGNA